MTPIDELIKEIRKLKNDSMFPEDTGGYDYAKSQAISTIKEFMKGYKLVKKGDEEWKLPKKDCTFQGFIVVNGEKRAICDAVGDDVSKEFCMYCQYWTRTMKHRKWKPYQTAERMTRMFLREYPLKDKKSLKTAKEKGKCE